MDREKLFSWEENPYISDFVREFGKPFNPDNDDYNASIYTEDIKSGKNDPIYNAHMYWTKVPPQGIAKLIEHFTSPGDLVLDPFCGSGMTGVAALLTGRNAILIDLCPAATFIAKNYTTPINPEEFKRAVREIEENVREEMDWLYETRCRKCGGKAEIIFTIWSDVYQCPMCETKMRFWDVAVKGDDVLRGWECPHCSFELNKMRARLVGTEPVEVEYRCEKCGRRRDRVSEFDLERLREIEEREIPYWYPRNEFRGKEPKRNYPRGIYRVDQFFTKRNLWALARLWKEAEEYIGDNYIRDKLLFGLTGVMFGESKINRFRADVSYPLNYLSGTLYVPSLMQERNVLNDYLNKSLLKISKIHFPTIQSSVIISTQSATNLSQIPNSSIDYCFTDPPYGANINYSELNFVWEAWLGHFTKIDEEAIINPVQRKGLDEYRELMEKSFREIFRVLKPGRFLTLTFHNSKTAVWEAIQTALTNAGFNLAYIGVFDKLQRTFNQVNASGAVGYDVLIHAYKPSISNGVRIKRKIEIEEAIDWLEERLRKLPKTINEEREGKRLHSEFIGWCLSQDIDMGHLVKLGLKDYEDFLKLLDENFVNIDGYYFLSGQIPSREQGQIFGVITDVASALQWLEEFLQEPKSYSEIQPPFLAALGGGKLERSLEDLLDENFIYTDDGKWRALTEKEKEEWGNIKRARQVRKFENWWRRFKRGEEKGLPPQEIMIAGLKEWYLMNRFWMIVEVKEMLRRRGIYNDCHYNARTIMEMAERKLRENG
ncbi:hypothetical protein H5T88_02665 [bacterium]|nr:hypothetical protein [bacterium]